MCKSGLFPTRHARHFELDSGRRPRPGHPRIEEGVDGRNKSGHDDVGAMSGTFARPAMTKDVDGRNKSGHDDVGAMSGTFARPASFRPVMPDISSWIPAEGRVPGIHESKKAWMAGTSPAMTMWAR